MNFMFPSRADLLQWVGQLTNTKVQRLEDLSDAVHFCQILDQIYPNNINLNKLKRDAKTSLEKEKNFRLLLNSINSLDISVTINIMDLASKKVTAILELLQWIYKEYQKSLKKIGDNDDKENNLNQSRMIKSYVGNLYTRQKSLHKNIDQNEKSRSMPSRKSLDSRLQQLKEQPNEEKKCARKISNSVQNQSQKIAKSQMVNEKIQKSQQKLHSQVGQQTSSINQCQQLLIDEKQPSNYGSIKKNSKCKDVWFRKEYSQKVFQEKCEKWKKDKNKKVQQEPEDIESIKKVLQRALTGTKQLISQKLIKVTNAVLENNPELREKLESVLRQVEDSKKKEILQNSAGNQSRSIFSSINNTSSQCEKDTLQDIQIDGFSPSPAIPSESDLQKIQLTVQGPQISQNNFSENKIVLTDKKETVKYSLIKPKQEKQQPSILFSNNLIKQISAQKQKAHNVFSQNKDQNIQLNNFSTNKIVNNMRQKFSNQSAYVTERKLQQKPEISEKREIYSDNSHLNHLRNKQQITKNQKNTQQITENSLVVQAESHANLDGTEKEEKNQYPDLPDYPPTFPSSHCRFF